MWKDQQCRKRKSEERQGGNRVWGGWRKVETGQDPLLEAQSGVGRSHPGPYASSTRDRQGLQPHHHFVSANEVGRLAEQLHIGHCHGTRLLPDQHSVVQLHVAPSYGGDQVLALDGQKTPVPTPESGPQPLLTTCPPARFSNPPVSRWRGHIPQ